MNKIWFIVAGVVAIGLLAAGIVLTMNRRSQPTVSPSTTVTSPPTAESTSTTVSNWKATGVAVAGTFADADAVKLADNSYRLYYAVQPEVQGNKFEIYSATSTNGTTWTQDAGTRKTMATFPDVVKLADGSFRMYFQSAGVIKSASSADGLSWKDESGTRIDATNDLGLTFDNVAAPTVLRQTDGTFLMVYRGTINEQYAGEMTPNKNTQLLLWATSTDGLSWTKKGFALDTRVVPYYGLADGPELFVDDDGSITLSFWTYTGVYWSNYTKLNGSFSTPTKVFALAESTTRNKFPAETPGDPTYATFSGTQYMYYGRPDGIHYAVRSAQ